MNSPNLFFNKKLKKLRSSWCNNKQPNAALSKGEQCLYFNQNRSEPLCIYLHWTAVSAMDHVLCNSLHLPMCIGLNVNSKKSPNVYESCPKIILLEKLHILTPLQKLPKWVLGKLVVATVFEKLPKSNKSPNLVTLYDLQVDSPFKCCCCCNI